MLSCSGNPLRILPLFAILVAAAMGHALAAASWSGVLTDASGKPVGAAIVTLHAASGRRDYSATTAADGTFVFAEIAAGAYDVSVTAADKIWKATGSVAIQESSTLTFALQLLSNGQELRVGGAETAPTTAPATDTGKASTQASGGEHLSSAEVSSLPLNERDFSKLLLLAAGTMTDTNGAANFTQQFAVNGQRGAATVFAV